MSRAWRAVRLTLAAGLCLALVLWQTACVSTQARVAHALAIAAAGLDVPARALERDEGLAALERAKAASGSRADGDAALARVEAKWAPVFDAWKLFLQVDDAWLVALQAEQSGDFGALLGAACKLAGALRPLAPQLVVRLDGVLGALCSGGAP